MTMKSHSDIVYSRGTILFFGRDDEDGQVIPDTGGKKTGKNTRAEAQAYFDRQGLTAEDAKIVKKDGNWLVFLLRDWPQNTK